MANEIKGNAQWTKIKKCADMADDPNLSRLCRNEPEWAVSRMRVERKMLGECLDLISETRATAARYMEEAEHLQSELDEIKKTRIGKVISENLMLKDQVEYVQEALSRAGFQHLPELIKELEVRTKERDEYKSHLGEEVERSEKWKKKAHGLADELARWLNMPVEKLLEDDDA